MRTVTPRCASRYSPEGGSLTRKLSVALGRTPGGVSQAIWGPDSLPNKTERLLFQLVRHGASGLAQRIVDRLQAVISNRPAPALDGALFLSETRADAEEDIARTGLQVALADDDPSNDQDAARHALRLLDIEIARKQEFRAALAVKAGVR